MSLLPMNQLINLWLAIAIIGVVSFAYFKGHSNGEARTQFAYLQEIEYRDKSNNNCNFDTEGMRLINEFINAANSEPPAN
jgi:hypothetical protein